MSGLSCFDKKLASSSSSEHGTIDLQVVARARERACVCGTRQVAPLVAPLPAMATRFCACGVPANGGSLSVCEHPCRRVREEGRAVRQPVRESFFWRDFV